MRIIEVVATRCQILRLTALNSISAHSGVGAYSVPPDPITAFKGPTSRGRGGGEGQGRREDRSGGKGKGCGPPGSFDSPRM